MKKLIVLATLIFSVSCTFSSPEPQSETQDVILIGGGIMSATLGTYIKELEPSAKITLFERLDKVAAESSDALNNAGTGHAAYCELNYTPEKPDGSIDTHKAVDITQQFEVSKQFWAHLVKTKQLPDARAFINNVPHMSFVWGEENQKYLKKRFEALSKEPLFKGMQYSEDPKVIGEWAPLLMKGREVGGNSKFAATRMEMGTDVNFGNLTRALIDNLTSKGMALHVGHEVRDIKRNSDQTWKVTVHDLKENKDMVYNAKFVFIGAGGGALPLLEKSGIEEAKGFGGFPVGGQWLITNNEVLIAQHQAKVYGKASVGSPPMSVPHLDTRIIDGKKALLFGPFATFSTKFLKNGSWLDLPASINVGNVKPMVIAGLDNIPLTQYLISQVLLSPEQRLASLRDYFPDAKPEDWRLENAGQRVQVIKGDPEKGGILQFGTEVVSAKDGSIQALLGASPGASTAAPIMLKVLKNAYPTKWESEAWKTKLKEMIPSFGLELNADPELANKIRLPAGEILGLKVEKI